MQRKVWLYSRDDGNHIGLILGCCVLIYGLYSLSVLIPEVLDGFDSFGGTVVKMKIIIHFANPHNFAWNNHLCPSGGTVLSVHAEFSNCHSAFIKDVCMIIWLNLIAEIVGNHTSYDQNLA